MACACKKTKKIVDSLTNQTNIKLKDDKTMVKLLQTSLSNVFNRLVMILLFIILIPILMLFFILNLGFKDNMTIKIPKIFKKL